MPSLRKTALFLVTAATLVPSGLQAAGQLMVNPVRIVFEARTRTAQIDVINNSTEEATYRISLVRKRMTERGEFVMVDQPLPGENFADDLVRVSPRQVTLPPGGAQIVRLRLRKPAELAPGEYRSHLVFQAQPPRAQPAGAGDRAPTTASDGIHIELTAIVSLSIPVIVRQGETSATIAFTNVSVKASPVAGDPPFLSFDLVRAGNRSVYGDVVVSFTRRGGNELIVARANGVAVYVPNGLRRAQVPLQLPPNQKLANGRLQVSFVERPKSGGKVLADTKLDLP